MRQHNLENCWEENSGILRKGGKAFCFLVIKETNPSPHCPYSRHGQSATHQVQTLGGAMSLARKSQREKIHGISDYFNLYFYFWQGHRETQRPRVKYMWWRKTSLISKAKRIFQGFPSLVWVQKQIGWESFQRYYKDTGALSLLF